MNYLRSALLALWLAIITPPYAIIAMASFPFSAHRRYRIISGWVILAMWGIRVFTGIRYRVLGRENIPDRPSVVMSKHQSAWETIALQRVFPPIVFVLKRELLRLPFFGWGLAQLPVIAIDRAAGREALQQVAEQGKDRLARGFWVVIFPEGTRVPVGGTRRYKAGGAWLASASGAQVVPVAHNAGEFWPRNSFLKRPGEITVSVGPAIDTRGLTHDQINAKVEAWIEAEMRRLFPHHYHDGPGRTAAA